MTSGTKGKFSYDRNFIWPQHSYNNTWVPGAKAGARTTNAWVTIYSTSGVDLTAWGFCESTKVLKRSTVKTILLNLIGLIKIASSNENSMWTDGLYTILFLVS